MARIYLSATRQSSGKTAVSIGIAAALRARGLSVQPFKKGPDYIDPMWISRAAQRPCFNLDFHTMSPTEIRSLYGQHTRGADFTLVEGTKGLFDGLDLTGEDSNAALAKLLKTPVILVVDARGMTRGVVPLVLGHQQFDTDALLAGIILNNLGGSRHESKLRAALEHYTDIPVIGAIPRDRRMEMTMRHLGLMPSNEAEDADRRIAALQSCIEDNVDLDTLLGTANQAPAPTFEALAKPTVAAKPDVRIGIARDSAFGFYYPDDLEQLTELGATLVPFNTMQESRLPDVDGLLIGGGFPETHLEALEKNRALRNAIREAIAAGMPCYAECGGLMYLARSITWHGRQYEMAGAIDGDVVMHPRPIGKGYTRLEETQQHPWPVTSVAHSAIYNAHEFHYSEILNLPEETVFAYRVLRGMGIDGDSDGIVHKNLLACYCHLRQFGGSQWCERFVDAIRQHRQHSGLPTAQVGS